ncbi:HNH endonuclease [Bradyrhizobium sp. INPA01-394B]|uniref:HNH endonuclease n=1 Tax=Bradyrhizobium campsiandrae TaxID=1729892 RepID=A0ABR7U960_9BRAD|nr:HNH endonuclease [Bradyrhizobium campsiandrae]MBC9980130.1 HNH endonuclease [Bradyrhizobium campsiandrae]
MKIKPTGSRRDDFNLANEDGKFPGIPKGYMWHHVDDFDPTSGEATLELIPREAHRAALPHAGSVAQYEKHHGVKYKR